MTDPGQRRRAGVAEVQNGDAMGAPTLPIHEAGQRAGLPAWGELPDSRVPGWAYTDQAFYREEPERFFYRGHWCYVGLECEISKAGDFKLTQLGERSVIVVRDNTGAVRRGQVQSKSVNDTCAAAQAGQHHRLSRLRPVIRQYPLWPGRANEIGGLVA